MDTPESPTQSPQSPEEEEKGLSDSELLESPESPAEEDNGVSDSELLNDEDGGRGGESDFDDEDRVEVGGRAPEEISDEDDGNMDGVAKRGMHKQEQATTMMEERPYMSRSAEQEEEEEILETPRSPDPDTPEPEQDRPFTPIEEEQDNHRQEGEEDRRQAAVGFNMSHPGLEEDDDDDEEERRQRGVMVVSDLKDESSSVSRELDEHELDYDEEVPEEPNTALQEEEDTDKGPGEGDREADEEEKDNNPEERKRKTSERNPILPPDQSDTQPKKPEDLRGPERGRRDSFRDKKKDEDDGEIDEGEIDDDDLEEGEVKDPMDRKIRPRPICRFFMKGNCTWGMICRFIHPGVNDKGNYSLISKPDPFSPNGAPPGGTGPHPLMPSNPWTAPAIEELPPPPLPVEPPVESAWERGLRHAKEVLKKATIRKEQEPDFEEKRFNVTIGEDERDFDKENEFFRDRGYRITREIRDPGEMEFRDPLYSDPYADPYYDYEMEAFWRGGQYENFRVQYTETPLPYHYSDRERERDPRERHRERERERERDHRERERRQRERERERERERDKERQRRKEEWERDRLKRDEKEGRPRERPLREPREKKEEKDKPIKPRSPTSMPPRGPMDPPPKKETVPTVKRPDEWKDPWRRSKSPRRRPGLLGSPPRGRRRHRPSGSSVSLSNSSRSSSRSSSYTGSGSSRSRSRSHSHSSSASSYSSHSSQHSSFTGSRSRSRSYSSSPSPTPSAQRNTNKIKAEQPPGHPLKPGALPPPRRDKGHPKKIPSPLLPGQPGKPQKAFTDGSKPPSTREAGRQLPVREPGKPTNIREGRRKEHPPHKPRRRTLSGSVSGSGSSYSGSSSRSRSRSSSASLSHSRSGSRKSRSLSVSSVSSVSSASSSSSSARSADTDDMYADLASPVSSASSHSPTPGHPRKERGPPRERTSTRDREPEKDRGKLPKKDENFKDERKKVDPSDLPPKAESGVPRSGPGNRGHAMNAPPVGPPGAYGSHKDIKLTLVNKQADRSNRKRYFPADKERPTSPLNKRRALSPDRGRDRRMPGRSPLSPRMDSSRGQDSRLLPPQGERKRPLSPPPKSSGKGPAVSTGKSAAPVPATGSGSSSGKPSSTLSRREELLKQLKAVEDAIARKRAKIPGK
ncbi:zinc finger CCCH domain-containing protein 18 isoform X2 [Hoplias malabaricus]|uniref:zinc finger CCCH domain-containing protein 18 isoform X2 n=1 Tax=Hoplias malabaricus TaxID=27720 RepID=UPI0034635CFA